MDVETTYVAGPGVLLGQGHHWLLLDDVPAAGVLDRWFSLVRTRVGVTDRLLSELDRHYRGAQPSLVLVDLTPGEERAEIRGRGVVTEQDEDRLLDLGRISAGIRSMIAAGPGGATSLPACVRRAEAQATIPPRNGRGAPSPTPPSTPLDVVPTQAAPPVPPEITGSRTGPEVAFRWRTGTPVLDGDTWEWKRTDTGAGQRTGETAVTVRATARVCLQVRMIRGTDASAWTEKCVD